MRTDIGLAARFALAVRYVVVICVLVATVGITGRLLAWPLLTATLGPTAYVFAAHPRTEGARFRNAVVGHSVAIGGGLASAGLFGLWHHPSVAARGAPTLDQVAAAVMAVGVTMLVLSLAQVHHAPAAASALLVATGLARPGTPLLGLAVGLAILVVLAPLCGMIPLARRQAAQQQDKL
jgi:hypothetical protein